MKIWTSCLLNHVTLVAFNSTKIKVSVLTKKKQASTPKPLPKLDIGSNPDTKTETWFRLQTNFNWVESRADFLERRIEIKSYQPFWCWNFSWIWPNILFCCFDSLLFSKILRLSDGRNHLYGINIQSLAFLRKKLKLNQYQTLKSKSWKIFSAFPG